MLKGVRFHARVDCIVTVMLEVMPEFTEIVGTIGEVVLAREGSVNEPNEPVE